MHIPRRVTFCCEHYKWQNIYTTNTFVLQTHDLTWIRSGHEADHESVEYLPLSNPQTHHGPNHTPDNEGSSTKQTDYVPLASMEWREDLFVAGSRSASRCKRKKRGSPEPHRRYQKSENTIRYQQSAMVWEQECDLGKTFDNVAESFYSVIKLGVDSQHPCVPLCLNRQEQWQRLVGCQSVWPPITYTHAWINPIGIPYNHTPLSIYSPSSSFLCVCVYPFNTTPLHSYIPSWINPYTEQSLAAVHVHLTTYTSTNKH